MEPVMFMPATLASHVAKQCNHVVHSLDENNNIGGVYLAKGFRMKPKVRSTLNLSARYLENYLS